MNSYKAFDPSFDKIVRLLHYPWIGEDYIHQSCKLLILGDSHYTVNDDGSFCQEEYDRCVSEKEYTRDILNRTVNQNDIWRMYQGLYALFGLSPFDAYDKLWKKIAFYNFVQTPMKQKNAKPKNEDFFEAWHCLLETVDVIKPDICLFIGVRGWVGNGKYEGIGESKVIFDTCKLSGSTPWTTIIRTSTGFETKGIAIHHTSQGFSSEIWKDYLLKKAPEIIGVIQ